MTNQNDKDRLAVRNLENALVSRLMTLSDEELLAEASEAGVDVAKEAEEVRLLFQRGAGKARMAAAKAEMEQHRFNAPRRNAALMGKAANDFHEAKGLTMAARNGTEQSEADIKTVADDLAQLGAFEDETKS